jgi:hypothetical protein
MTFLAESGLGITYAGGVSWRHVSGKSTGREGRKPDALFFWGAVQAVIDAAGIVRPSEQPASCWRSIDKRARPLYAPSTKPRYRRR